MKYPLVDISEAESTKERIMLAAVRLFAEKGYAAVSVRDIADAVHIKAASLYNHFESKEALFVEIVQTVKTVYLEFYDRMDEQMEKAVSFEQVLEILFSELKVVYHMFIYYGVVLIATEQFRNEEAGYVFNEVYMKVGIEYSEKIFAECIRKKWVKTFDAKGLATFFMNNVFVGSVIRVRQDLDYDVIYNPDEMFASLQQYMLNSVEVITP